jgi:hypothetical protein
MKKKSKIPKKFGQGITGNLFKESEYGNMYGTFSRICEETTKADKEDGNEHHDKLKEILKVIKNPEIKKDLKHWWLNVLPHWYSNVYLTVGFALGQHIDIITPEAQKEIDFVWKRLREEKLFFIYPREKKAA